MSDVRGSGDARRWRLVVVPALLGLVLTAVGALAEEKLSPEEQKLAQEAQELNDKGVRLYREGKVAEAVPLLEKALAMYQRLYPEERFPQGHPDLAGSLNNLGGLLRARGEVARAQPYWEKALAMRERLYPEERFPHGHPQLALSLHNLSGLLQARGEYAKAQPYLEKTLAMQQRLADTFADLASEAETINYLAFLPGTRDIYLTLILQRPDR